MITIMTYSMNKYRNEIIITYLLEVSHLDLKVKTITQANTDECRGKNMRF